MNSPSPTKTDHLDRKNRILVSFREIRQRTISLCQPLEIEDFVVQPSEDVSPPKWHLAHSTWFFENFILSKDESYSPYHPQYNYLFNSYYEGEGARVLRKERGFMSRPTVAEIASYRIYVNEGMERLLSGEVSLELLDWVEVGLHHEQQHQELLLTDIKYILGHNPMYPEYDDFHEHPQAKRSSWVKMDAGMYKIGFRGDGFSFDNELGAHEVYLPAFDIKSELVSNGEYLEFIEGGGYNSFEFWHAEGWEWVKTNNISAPLYWHKIDGVWHHYTLEGLQAIDPNKLLTHVSFYEAAAYAEWKELRLLTEFEWEAAHEKLNIGSRWEWTNSAYLPYPKHEKAPGALGEYNAKFMLSQMVLRGGSVASPPNHVRPSYRNFFHPHLRWQYTGIRLAKKY